MKQEPFLPDRFYHIYNRGNNRENIFIEEKNYHYFLNLLKKYISPIAHVLSYCLLKNHFHLLVQIKSEEEIPEKYLKNGIKIHLAFSNMFNAYTKAINKAYNRTGSLFQEHLHRIRITDDRYLKQVIVYIHLNPLKHKFSDNFSNYEYSSYNSIISSKQTNLYRNYVLDLFEDKDNFVYCHYETGIKYDGLMSIIDETDI